MSLTSLIIKNTGLSIMGRMISTALGLLAVAILTRSLGVAGFGEYTIATSFLQFFGIIVDFGLTLTALQMIAEAPDETAPSLNADRNSRSNFFTKPRLVANLLSLRLISGALFFLLPPLIILCFPYSGSVKLAVAVGALSYLVLALNQMLVGIFQKYLAMQYAMLAEVIGRAGLALGIALAAAFGYGVVAMLVVMGLANIIQLALLLFFAHRYVPLHFEVNLAIWRQIIARAWPIGVSTILNLIYLKSDVLILSLTKFEHQVGIYGAAYKVLDVLTVIPMMFMGLILPLLTESWLENRRERFTHLLTRSFDALSLLALPTLIGGILLARPIITLIGGAEFSGGGPLLAVLIVGLFLVFYGTLFGHTVVALSRQRSMIWGYLVVALVSLAAYLIFIPRFGALAAAWVTVFSEGAIALLTFLMVARVSRAVPPLKLFLKAFLATLIMGAALYPFRHISLALTVPLGAGVYVLALFTLGAFPRELMTELRALIKL